MQELDMEFFEEYKRTDAIVSDMLSCGSGISEYIDEMDRTPYELRASETSWSGEYQDLKRLRHIRNRLAHDNIEAGICSYEDLALLRSFHDRLLNCRDPLALSRREAERLQEQRRAEQSRRSEQKSAAVKAAPEVGRKKNGEQNNAEDDEGQSFLMKFLAFELCFGIIFVLFVFLITAHHSHGLFAAPGAEMLLPCLSEIISAKIL